MADLKIQSCVREAKRLIPRSGLGKDMHTVLDDVLHQRSRDVAADLARVANACKPLPWGWAKSAVEQLEKAAQNIDPSSEIDASRR